MATNEKELLQFALSLAGGEQEVRKQFIKDRLFKAITGGATVGEIISKAEAEGWIDTLKAIPFADLLGMSKGKKRGSSGRLTKEAKEAAVAAIQNWLKEHKWGSKADLTVAAGVDAAKMNGILAGMRNEDLIKTAGSKRNTVYALFNERTKAPVE